MMVREGPIFDTPLYHKKNAMTMEKITVKERMSHPATESLANSRTSE